MVVCLPDCINVIYFLFQIKAINLFVCVCQGNQLIFSSHALLIYFIGIRAGENEGARTRLGTQISKKLIKLIKNKN